MQRRTSSGPGAARRAVTGTGRGATGRGGRDGGARPRPTGRTSGGGPVQVTHSGRRPAAARRATRAGGAERTRAPQPHRLSGRAIVLMIILLVLALGYTYPIRVYLSQQADIKRTEADLAAQRERVGALNQQAVKWQDDEYVRIQARRRLNYVSPGEKLLVVVDQPGTAEKRGTGPGTGPALERAWYRTLWSSIQAANDPPAPGGSGR